MEHKFRITAAAEWDRMDRRIGLIWGVVVVYVGGTRRMMVVCRVQRWRDTVLYWKRTKEEKSSRKAEKKRRRKQNRKKVEGVKEAEEDVKGEGKGCDRSGWE